MRVIRLDGSEKSKELFVILFQAARSGAVEGIEQIRRVGKIMDKLEAAAVTEGEGDAQTWQLAPDGAEIWLEGAEFNELKNRITAAKWLPNVARTVAQAFDLVESAAEEDPSKPRIVPSESPADVLGG